MCCSSIFWLKVWDGAQPDERVWTLASAGRADGDRPATAPRIASHAHHPRSRIPDTPPANSTGPPRVHATMRRKTERVTGSQLPPPYGDPSHPTRTGYASGRWGGRPRPTAPRAAGSRAPVRTATSRVACHAPLLWLEPGARDGRRQCHGGVCAMLMHAAHLFCVLGLSSTGARSVVL